MPGERSALLAALLTARRFVRGKGGTGKSTIAGTLALVAAGIEKRVLCIEVDAKGDLAHTRGAKLSSFARREVQPNINLLAPHPEESLHEYLWLSFKIPPTIRLTPPVRVLDVVANRRV